MKHQERQYGCGDAWRHFLVLVFIFTSGITAPAYAETLTAANYAGGDGTELTPYLVSNLSELRRLSETPLDWTMFFELSANIDAGDTSTWNSLEGWQPIGYMNNSSSVISSYASGSVTGKLFVGGLAGAKGLNGAISLSYWDKETSGTTTGVGDGPSGATGLTSAQMKLQESFPGFDFSADWLIIQELTPPLFQWRDMFFNNGFEGG